jgi:hypothetical protein
VRALLQNAASECAPSPRTRPATLAMGAQVAIHTTDDGRLMVSHTDLVVSSSAGRHRSGAGGHNSDEASVAQVPIKSRPLRPVSLGVVPLNRPTGREKDNPEASSPLEVRSDQKHHALSSLLH